MRGLSRTLVAAVAAALLAGCGGGAAKEAGAPDASASWVDVEGEEPLVGSIAVDPGDGGVWLSTNRGLYRVHDGAEPQRIAGRLETTRGSGRISAQLVVSFAGPGEMLGSGHPPPDAGLPPALGLLRSTDGARTWASVSELGSADFHVIEQAGDRLVGALYGESQVLVSDDAGRLWTTRAAPGPTTDLAVDPADPSRWVASTPSGLFASSDEGRSWRQRDLAGGSSLVWPEDGPVYRADPGGAVHASADRGQTWEQVGELSGGDPAALAASAPEEVYAATVDGGIERSTDGGRTWAPVLEP